MERKRFALIAWTALVTVTVIAFLYHRQWMPVKRGDLDIALYSRGIATPLLLWLNGYLGIFFNFQFLGTAGTLGLPIMIYGVYRWRHLLRWQQALLSFTVLAVFIIGAFGGFNYRYALTLQPLFTVAVFALAWMNMAGRGRAWFIVALAAVSLLNTALALEHRQRTWHAEPEFSSPDTKPGTLKERLDAGPRDLEGMLRGNGVRPTDTVLVNNLPIWYYITTRPGVYFWCGSDQLFMANGKAFLFRDRTDEQVLHYLADSLHCRYIFSTEEYNRYHPGFQRFIEDHTELLEQDDRGHTLHRLKDNFGR